MNWGCTWDWENCYILPLLQVCAAVDEQDRPQGWMILVGWLGFTFILCFDQEAAP